MIKWPKLHNKSYLTEMYICQKLSTLEIASQIGCSSSLVRYWMKRYAIARRKLSEALLGNTNNNGSFKGKKHSEETKNKIRYSKIGLPRSAETKLKISETLIKSGICKGSNNPTFGITGKNHPAFKEPNLRYSLLDKQIRSHQKYKKWRLSCFERDGYTCQSCNQLGGKLQVDHIIPLVKIRQIHNLSFIEDALECKVLWDLSNGRTLCVDCHKNTDTFAAKARFTCLS